MANMNVTVVDGNNLVVNVDKGVSGVGIESVSIVYQDPYYYLDIQYTNGTNELVQLPSIVAGVVSFNTRIGVVTLEFTDVTDALGYIPPEPDGTGATGTWNISVTGNAATVTNGVYTTGTYSNPLWITALAGSKITGDISGNAENVNGTVAITHGGTGQITANAGFNALAPSQAGNAGKYLKTDGTNASWDQLDISTADITGILPVVNGGTGASTASGARTNLNAADQATTISAGTGLSGGGDLSANRTISIANTGVTAASYGSASKTLTATVNAQGQLTNIADTPIAIANTQVSGLGTASTLNAGVANGVATLDSAGTVPLSQINPALIGSVSYQGTWNASTNTPTLTSSVGTKGYYYVVSVAGSTNLNGITNWNIGDWAIFDGSSWGKVDNTDSVTSVNGYTGAVVLSYSDVGAPSTSGTNATGTWGISVSGNAGTVTNGVYTTDVGTVTNTMLAGSIANNKLTNSTISGVSLGSNLNELTIGSGLSGTSYNGSAAVTITNTAPDQIVSLTGGTGISTSGTYPNFTITNTAPDQIVSLTGAGTTSISGTYPNFTITSNDAYTGTVTSVGTGTGLTGGPITTTGTISFSNANVGTWAATPSSANLAAAMTDETGSGSLVFGTNPTLSSPNINVIDFDQTYATTLTAGQMGWDGHDTLGLGMVGGNVIQRIGEDQYYYVKASSAITKGQVIMFTGAVGASGVITAAPASGVTDGAYIMGVAAESIALNGFGLVQSFGNLKGLDTAAFTLGDILWYNPAVTGGLTAIKPSAPNVKVQVAAVTNAGNGGSGSIQIRVSSGSTLGGTDSNVQFGTLSGNDLIQYNGTYWTNIAPSSLTGVGSVANSLTFNNSGTGDASGSTFNGSAAKTLSYNSIGAQPTLVSGTNIKTVNGTSLLGTGDLGTIGIGYGGTGQTTANAAFNALAPSQTGNAGKYLTTDGSNTSWATNPLGTVTSVSGTGTVSGITLTGTVTTSGDLTLGGSLDLSSPPAIGSASPNTGAFTTLTTSSTVTLSGGTANGVAYLNASKVLTTGSALTFDGTNFGVGVTPDAINYPFTSGSLQFTGGNSIYPWSADGLYFQSNAYYNSGWKYKITSASGQYVLGAGVHIWNTAPSGTAGNGLSFAEQMRLTSTGLGIGTSSPSTKLDVRGNAYFSGNATSRQTAQFSNTGGEMFVGLESSSGGAVFGSSSAYASIIGSNNATPLQLGTNGTIKATLDSSGNLGLGVTPSAWYAFSKAIDIGSGGAIQGRSNTAGTFELATNAYLNSSGNWTYKASSVAANLFAMSNGSYAWNTAPSGTAGNAISFTQAMTLDASGRLGVGTTSPAERLDIRNDTSGTQIRVGTSDNGNIFLAGWETGASFIAAAGYNSPALAFKTSGSERARIDNSGNLGLGVTPSATAGAWKMFELVNNGTGLVGGYGETDIVNNLKADRVGTFSFVNTAYAARYSQSAGVHVWSSYNGTAGASIAGSGTAEMKLDTSGNLGLGVTPSAWGSIFKAIQTSGGVTFSGRTDTQQLNASVNWCFDGGTNRYIANGFASRYIQESGVHAWQTAPSGTAGNAISWTQAMTLDASGNLGVGTTSPTAQLGIYSSNVHIQLQNATTGTAASDGSRIYLNGSDLLLVNRESATMQFYTADTERMRIDSSGNLLVGTTSTGGNDVGFRVYGPYGFINSVTATADYSIFNKSTTATGKQIQFRSADTTVGDITCSSTSTTYNTSSDYRLKENIQPMQNALATVAQLNPVTYTWKADGSDGQGFIAHELQAVVPDCVTGEKDAVDAEGNPVYQGIDTSFLVATLTKAIQEQQQLIEALTARVAQLEGN